MGKKDDFWLDDPEWDVLRRRAEKRPIPKELKNRAKHHPAPAAKNKNTTTESEEAKPTDTTKEVVVNLKLSVPKIRFTKIKQLYGQHRKKFWFAGAVTVVGVSVVLLLPVLKNNGDGKVAGTNSDPSKAAQEEAQANFNPLVPLENLKDATGKQSNPEFRYDKEKQVLGYMSDYNESQLTVSQQKLPDDLKKDPGKLAALALAFKADKPIQTQKGTAYMATDEKSKAQTVVFVTDEVLVFVRSSKMLDEDEWVFYINQLNPRQ